ncbi:MAG: hypothetical protein EYC71_03790 [Gammaproteobacteria bacterium]|nr:MAG: hypothetical protein EYC71_03790 [Gammaproteobacteria bacterium]
MEPPGPTAPHWDASGKPAGVYQYRVRSCLTLCGNPSAIVTETVTGGGGGQAPGAPTMNPPGAGSNTGQIALSWSPAANPSPQPDYYMVQENGGYNIHVPSGTSLSLTRGNGTFTYKVRGCRNNPGHPANPFCGTFSDPVTVTVNASSIPAVPTGVRTDPQRECPGPRTATYAIRWNTSPGATRYELTETNGNTTTTSTDTEAVSPESFTHSVPVGLDSITYTYKVRACNASGCSQDSAATFACLGVLNQPNGPDSTPIATAYDAFGKVRNGDYSDRPGGKLNLLPDTVRGFTNHQHVDDVRLIHMNGRVYDYTLGRFLSVDPIIQFPANSQSLNPYSYIMNNPLSGRDPSGYAIKPPWPIVQPDSLCMGGDMMCKAAADEKFLAGPVGELRASLSSGGMPQGNGWAQEQSAKLNQVKASVEIGAITTVQETRESALARQTKEQQQRNEQAFDLDVIAKRYGVDFSEINFVGADGPYQASRMNVFVDPDTGLITHVIGPPQEAGSGLVRATLAIGRAAGFVATRGGKLSRAMIASGILRPGGTHAHHIVAQAAKIAAPARAVLTRFGVNLHEASNGAFLVASRHAGLHTRRYYDAVNNVLSQATSRQEVLQMLSAIRQGLQAGTFP